MPNPTYNLEKSSCQTNHAADCSMGVALSVVPVSHVEKDSKGSVNVGTQPEGSDPISFYQ